MRISLITLCLLLGLNYPLAADEVDRPGKGDWCYLPTQPLTISSKHAFVDEISPAARQAEHDWGVPAAMIAAMAIVESGYGTTRLAIRSNNILAFKWPGDTIAHGLGKFVLWCQPGYDLGNVYPLFQARRQAIFFVASRLKLNRHYSGAAIQYQNDLANSVDRKKAAHDWLVRIAPLYNWKPEHYIPAVENIASDPIGDKSVSLWELKP